MSFQHPVFNGELKGSLLFTVEENVEYRTTSLSVIVCVERDPLFLFVCLFGYKEESCDIIWSVLSLTLDLNRNC